MSVWVCLFVIGIVGLSDERQVRSNRYAYHALIWLGAVLANLLLAPYLRHPWDFDIWIDTAQDLLSGRNPYDVLMSETLKRGYNFPYYDYPPLWAFILVVHYILFLCQPVNEVEVLRVILKIPLIASSLLTGYLLYTILRERGERFGLMCFAAYSLNPFVILQSSGLGLHDTLAAFFSLLAFSLFYRGKRDSSAVALGLAIAAKMYPVFLLAPFLSFIKGMVRKVRFAFLSATPLMVFSVPFLLWNSKSYLHMLVERHAYSRPHGFSLWELYRQSWYFFTETVDLWVFPNFRIAMPLIILLTIGVYVHYRGKEVTLDNLSSACLAVALIETILAIESHPSFFVWVAPFILLRRRKNTWLVYSLLTISLYLYLGVGYPLNRFWGRPPIPGYRRGDLVRVVAYSSGMVSVLLEVILLLSTLGLHVLTGKRLFVGNTMNKTLKPAGMAEWTKAPALSSDDQRAGDPFGSQGFKSLSRRHFTRNL